MNHNTESSKSSTSLIGYDEIKLQKEGLLIKNILNSHYDLFDLHVQQLKNGLVIVDLLDYIFLDSDVMKEIYRKTGLIIQAIELRSNDCGHVRTWFGTKRFVERTGYVKY